MSAPAAAYAACHRVPQAHERAVSAVKFSPSGHMLASCSADCEAKIWKVGSDGEYSPLSCLSGHAQGINDMEWTADSKHVFTAGDDKLLKLWDVETGKCLVDLKGHTNFVFCCSLNLPRGDILSSGSFDEQVKLWDVRQAREIRSLSYHSEPVTATDFTPDGSTLVSASHDGFIRVCDVGSGACLKHFYAQGNPHASCVSFSPSSQYLLVSTLDSTLRLWGANMDAHSLNPAKIYTGHVNHKFCIPSTFVLNAQMGPCVASGSEDNKVYIWDVQSLKVVQTLEGHADAVLGLSEHPREAVLATGSMNGEIIVWREGYDHDQGQK